jgi:hypothetical protein
MRRASRSATSLMAARARLTSLSRRHGLVPMFASTFRREHRPMRFADNAMSYTPNNVFEWISRRPQ